jgi:hypothetical protein
MLRTDKDLARVVEELRVLHALHGRVDLERVDHVLQLVEALVAD